MLKKNGLLVYGANGYTGRLIVEEALANGFSPVLAGRNEACIGPLAKQYGLDYHIVPLSAHSQLTDLLCTVQVVIHAAGPFKITAKPMVEACLEAGTHYVDITGEIDVFEMIKAYDAQAKEKKIMLLPGAGFDVVPTDCLALYVKKQLPDASQLRLAFALLGSTVSHGTATTMAMHLGEPGATRKNGKIIAEPIGQQGRWIDFGRKKLFSFSIPWGDISTAYTTTGIPNIQTFTAGGRSTFRILKYQKLFNWLLQTKRVRSIIQKKINRRPAGPSADQRNKGIALIWGQAENDKGEKRSAILECPEGYSLTAMTSILIVKKIIAGHFHPGFQTPACAYGENLILEVQGVLRKDNTSPSENVHKG